MRFAAVIVVSFVGMEFFSYLVHRFVYHKLMWVLHKSHHTRREGIFELNDLFPLAFATATIFLMVKGSAAGSGSDLLAASIGIALYGVVYFAIHDLYVHRRAKFVSLKIPWLIKVKKAHALHHRYGGEPYGLLMFFNAERVEREVVDEEEVV
jgi:beta-carotene 3-hydroxylase